MKAIKRELPHLGITVHMTDSRDKAKKLVETHLKESAADMFNEDVCGMVYFTKSTAIMCVADNKLSSLCHECFHLGVYIAEDINGDTHGDSEPYAYAADYCFREFLEHIWGIEDAQA